MRVTLGSRRDRRPVRLPAAVVLSLGATIAAAQTGPFGVGLPETGGGAGWTGPFASLVAWIAAEQAAFYRALTAVLKALREDGTAVLSLVGLSFLYGVFHAAGPGHGKVVLTSYILANEATLKRGVALSFASSLVQATSAVLLVSIFAALLGATSMAITQASRVLELGSYLAIVVLGAVLLWRKLWLPVPQVRSRPASLGAAAVAHSHAPDGSCCGHSHVPHPRSASAPWRAALSAVLAVGARPCTGAVIVLVFALAQGLFTAGIASAYLMGLGTAITVSALAALAVYGKRVAVDLIGASAGGRWPMRLFRGVEITGALLVLGFGLVLFVAALRVD